MPKAGECTVCRHRKVAAINRAVVAGEMSLQKIAKSFRVPYQSLYRHRLRHLPTELVKRKEESIDEAAQGLVHELEGLVKKTTQVLSKALAKGDGDLALRAIARRERQIELKGRLLGQLEERSNAGMQTIQVVYVDKQLITGTTAPVSQLALQAGREVDSEAS